MIAAWVHKIHNSIPFSYVDSAGELSVIEGLLKPEDKEAAIEAGVLEASTHKSEA